jgi:hypothetical protein
VERSISRIVSSGMLKKSNGGSGADKYTVKGREERFFQYGKVNK